MNEGDRIAQMIIEKYTMTSLLEVETLDDTARGAGGFGSTGVAAAPSNGEKKPAAAQATEENKQ